MKQKCVPVEPWCCGSSGHLWSKRIWVLFQLFSKCFSFLGGKVVEKNWKLCDLNIALVDEGFVIPRFKLWDIFGLAATTPLDLDSKPICIVWLFWCLRVGWKKVKWQFVEKLNCQKVILLKSQIAEMTICQPWILTWCHKADDQQLDKIASDSTKPNLNSRQILFVERIIWPS